MALSFVADRTLGKLVKWLRLMGFDTIIESGAGGNDFQRDDDCVRLLLTRTGHLWKSASKRTSIWIESNDPDQQIRQVISELEIKYSTLNPFTRCLGCNEPLKMISRNEALGLVPDYVWETQVQFSQCPGCLRIFWQGSHISRIRKRLNELFSDLTRTQIHQK